MSSGVLDYRGFLEEKQRLDLHAGPAPADIPEECFDFQRYLIDWAYRRKRAAIFADCGLGKTPMQLAWADNVHRLSNKPVLILTPLAVSHQTVREGEKFGIECKRCIDGKHSGGIVVTNYERLHYFDRSQFAGVVCDESSAIKNFDGKRKKEVTEFMRHIEYRLLCTATAAPNDFFELGTSSEALGHLGWRDMITKFFRQETSKDRLGWGRTHYRFRGHAERPFWRWVCSWARAIRNPSDLGFSDDRFILPELVERETVVEAKVRPGLLFAVPAKNMQEERQERRVSMDERCHRIADMVSRIDDRPAIVWCHLNDEGDLLEKIIPDAAQVKGSMSDEAKEENLLAFTDQKLRVLVTKPKIGCWGLNWQHCSDIFMFPSHSFEQYYQAIRRCYRFGQENSVSVDIVTTEGELSVLRNLRRKADQANSMFTNIVECMANELSLEPGIDFNQSEELPQWLS